MGLKKASDIETADLDDLAITRLNSLIENGASRGLTYLIVLNNYNTGDIYTAIDSSLRLRIHLKKMGYTIEHDAGYAGDGKCGGRCPSWIISWV